MKKSNDNKNNLIKKNSQFKISRTFYETGFTFQYQIIKNYIICFDLMKESNKVKYYIFKSIVIKFKKIRIN